MRYILLFFLGLFLIACNQETNNQQSTKNPVNNNTDKACIERIISLDDSLGSIRNHACEAISLSQTIENYVASTKKLNYQGCSEDFTDAFLKHRQAWAAMKLFTEKYPDLRGELHEIFDQIAATEDSTIFKGLLKPILGTWEDVKKAKGN